MSDATVRLGRDGLGNNADEAFFDAWVAFVTENIDEATGLDVAVKTRDVRDVQSDIIMSKDDPTADIVGESMDSLWDQFCSKM